MALPIHRSILFGALGFGLMLQGQVTHAKPTHLSPLKQSAQNSNQGRFCNIRHINGDWWAWFTNDAQTDPCQYLRQYQGATGNAVSSTYLLNGENEVHVNCQRTTRRSFTGVGDAPLRQAYASVSSPAQRHCQFQVRSLGTGSIRSIPRRVVNQQTIRPTIIRPSTSQTTTRTTVSNPAATAPSSTTVTRTASPTTVIPTQPTPSNVTRPSAPTATPPSNQQAVAPTPTLNGNYEAELLRLTNAERQRAGLPPLRLSSGLNRAAQRHAEDMGWNNFFNHMGSDGSQPADRARTAGYNYSFVGENIFAGRPTAEQAVQAWMNSPGHRANILKPEYSEIGFGYVHAPGSQYGYYWVQVFGTPR